MADRPFLIGLTGSIGMGKSETAKMFARLGIPVNDSDANVHALYEPGGTAVPLIEKAFPGTVRDGRVDRAALNKVLQTAPANFKTLKASFTRLSPKYSAIFWERRRPTARTWWFWTSPFCSKPAAIRAWMRLSLSRRLPIFSVSACWRAPA